jgi:hypothetical protein
MVHSPLDAIDLRLTPKRLTATLRTQQRTHVSWIRRIFFMSAARTGIKKEEPLSGLRGKKQEVEKGVLLYLYHCLPCNIVIIITKNINFPYHDAMSYNLVTVRIIVI